MENGGFDPYHRWLGIPPREQPVHYYRLLGLALFESDASAVANAADRRIAHVRTFESGPHGPVAQRILSELAAARLTLTTAEKKHAYDGRLKAKLAALRAAGAAAAQPVAKAAGSPTAASGSAPAAVATQSHPATAAPTHGPAPTSPIVAPSLAARPLPPASPSPSGTPAPMAMPALPTVASSPPGPVAQSLPSQSELDAEPVARTSPLKILAMIAGAILIYVSAAFITYQLLRRPSAPSPSAQPTTPGAGVNPPNAAPPGAAAQGSSGASGAAPATAGSGSDEAGKAPPYSQSLPNASPSLPPANASAPPSVSVGSRPVTPPPAEGGLRGPATPVVITGAPPQIPPLSLKPASVQYTPEKAVDLLSQVELPRDSTSGRWRLEGKTLVSDANIFEGRVMLPGQPPTNYRLTVRGVRESGGSLGLGLVVDGRQVVFDIDANDRRYTGLNQVDGFTYGSPGSTTKITNMLGDNEPYTIVCSVQGEEVSATVNDKQVLDWRGSSERLSTRELIGLQASQRNRLFLHSGRAVHRIEQITLEPLVPSSVASGPPAIVMLPPGSIDLIPKISPIRDSVYGKYLPRKARPGGLAAILTHPVSGARMRIPGPVPDSYVLTVQGVRESPGSVLAIGLVVGGSQAVVLLDRNGLSGLEMVDGRGLTYQPGSGLAELTKNLLPVGERYLVRCTVRHNAIQVVANDRQIVSWQGDPSRLSLPKQWSIPATDELFLGTITGVHRIEQLVLTPFADAKFPPRDSQVYLCDQPLLEMSSLHVNFPLRSLIEVRGTNSPHGLYMHPERGNRPATAKFELGGKFREFAGQVSIHDRAPQTDAPMTFRVVGDDRELWKSGPVQNRDQAETFKVDVTGVQNLELVVTTASLKEAHAVWIEPRLQ